MWLVLDIGNTRTKGGLFKTGAHVDTFHFATPVDLPGWLAVLRAAIKDRPIARAGLTSVVPAHTPLALQAIEDLYDIPAMEVTWRLRLPFRLEYASPETLGTDRLAAAVAAWNRFGNAGKRARPVIVIDAGTAINYEVIDADGRYLGGVIAAGPAIVRDALTRGTAQLPEAALELPASVVGSSTGEALQSGIMHAFVDGIEGMLARLATEMQRDGGLSPIVVATGGWGSWLNERAACIDHVDPHLVLRGIHDLLELNPPTRR